MLRDGRGRALSVKEYNKRVNEEGDILQRGETGQNMMRTRQPIGSMMSGCYVGCSKATPYQGTQQGKEGMKVLR